MTSGPPSRSSRPDPEDRSIRRTWWLLSGAFLLLAVVAGLRAIGGGNPLDWLVFVAVAVAALAAIGHRNAVAGLESRGRAEAESFARILRGLSRSVSGDAIVGAIVDELADGTGSDHVVVVRRSSDGLALEATLVTRRAGVPSSTTLLPLSDLVAPLDREVPFPVGVPIEEAAGPIPAGPELREPVGAAVGGGAVEATTGAARIGVPASAHVGAGVGDHAGAGERTPYPFRRLQDRGPGRGTPRRRVGDATAEPFGDRARRLVRAGLAETAALLGDLGLQLPSRASAHGPGPSVEVLGSGDAAAIAARISERVRSVYGLKHTLATPLRTEDGLVGAIVLSRRDRDPWSDAARRLLRGAAAEASAALARASTLREATARASTDPLTGLPNRRYFDEFCGLLARRRRSGDAVAVLMIDIDHFKRLNDTYGHPVGDEVLRAVAGAIATAVRDEDVPARVGGEEFAVLLRNPGPGIPLEVGERVRDAVGHLDLRSFGVSGVTVSVGAAGALGADEPIDEIIERADRALLTAKRTGRDRVVAL